MLGCFFARKPPPEVDFLLRALDSSDYFELAAMYGEARDRFKSADLMAAINKRMTEVARAQRAAEGNGDETR